jgi:mono/diheme cytochrome c family protein
MKTLQDVALRVSAGIRRTMNGASSRRSCGGLQLALAVMAGVPALHAGYKIENIPYPAELRGGISSVTFTPSGTLVISTRYGEIWMRRGDGTWRLFMRGLDEPMGIVADSESVIYVAHRPELLRATDKDGDGRADTFDAINAKWGQTINYHEFFFGLRRDKAGNFYGTLSLESLGEKDAAPNLPHRGPRDVSDVLERSGQRSETTWRGWAVRITPDGKLEPLAAGFRHPNGVALSPNDEMFVTDNQGDYTPSTGLLHVERGDFHGQVASLRWEPGFDAKKLTTEAAWRRLKTPAVVFPHGPMGISPGEPVWDQTGGKFGPFTGQVFTGDYSKLVIRSSLERVAGGWQGVCFPFIGRNESPDYISGARLKAGITRAAFGPDGSLYFAATAGWGAGEDGLQRISWDGRVSPEIRDIKITDRGFNVSFTRPMDPATVAKSDAYEITRFRYYYHSKYGSPWVDEERVAVKETRVAADRLSAEVVLAELKPGFVYEISVPTLRTTEGAALANPLAYYTANRLLNGERTVGGTTRLPQPDEKSLGAKEAIAALTSPAALVSAGEKIYRMYCVGCHQPDGRGIPAPGGAANFVDDKTRLAKTDAELLDIIEKGKESTAMPPFGAILSPLQRKSVLAYIRETFGEKK